MIESLTDEQKELFPEYVDRYIKIGTNTKPIDVDLIRTCLHNIYPEEKNINIFVADSPYSAKLVLEHNLDFNVVFDANNEQQISFKDLQALPSNGKKIEYNIFYGQENSYWVAFYSFLNEVLKIDLSNDFFQMKKLIENSYWIFQKNESNLFIVSRRPKLIKLNDDRVIHNETGPAIEFQDGNKIYAWNGVVVPDHWIEEKDSLKPEEILKWENIEQRRCGCEIVGWHNILNKLNAVVIDEDPDPEIGVLLEVNLPDVGKEKFLKVLCGTGRTFALPVPPNMKTALEAQSWTWEIDSIDFIKPEVRT